MRTLFPLVLAIVLLPIGLSTVQASATSNRLANDGYTSSTLPVLAPDNIDQSTIVFNDLACWPDGDNILLCFDAAVGATEYVFNLSYSLSINGMSGTQPITVPAQNGGVGQQCFTFEVIAPSSGSVCVTPQNSSGQADEVCLSYIVQAITPTILPPIYACANQPFTWSVNNVTYPTPPSTLKAVFTAQSGCDSIVTQMVLPRVIPPTIIPRPVIICTGDTLIIEEEKVYEAGTFSHTYLSIDGCDSMVIFSVIENKAQAVITKLGSPNCHNNSTLELDASESEISGDGGYQWYYDGNLVGTDITYMPTNSGQYMLVVTSEMINVTCTDQTSIDVDLSTIDLGIQINAGSGLLDCVNPTLDILLQSTSSNVTFQWIGPNGFASTTQNIQVNQPGLYEVIVTDANGCTDIAEVSIGLGNDNLLQNVSIQTTDVSCHGDTDGCAQVSGISGEPPYSFYWSDGQVTDVTICNLAAGQYSVTVVDGNGCSGVEGAIIEEPAPIQVYQYVSNPIINQQNGIISPSVSGGTPPYIIVLTDHSGVIMPNLHALGAGSYQLTVTDANGCSTIVPITLQWNNTIGAGHTSAPSVFPNPIRRQALIQWPTDIDVHAIEIHNLWGQQVLFQTVSDGDMEWTLDMSHLPQGSYQLLMHTTDEVLVYPDLLLKQE